jgi:hypothetical protein
MNSGGAKKADLEYYQVIELFDKGEVTKYNLNIGSGALTYELKDGTTAKYSVPNVSLFIEDIHDSVVEYNYKKTGMRVFSHNQFVDSLAQYGLFSLLV